MHVLPTIEERLRADERSKILNGCWKGTVSMMVEEDPIDLTPVRD
jgi:hypothetical protein